MGIRDLLKRRRDRESALPPEALEALGSAGADGAPPEPAAGEGSEQAGDSQPAAPAIELPGADAAELGELLRRAAETGMPQVSFERHRVEREGVAGGDLGAEILSIIAGAGASADAGDDADEGSDAFDSGGGPGTGARELDPDEIADLRDRVRAALRESGIDPDTGGPV